MCIRDSELFTLNIKSVNYTNTKSENEQYLSKYKWTQPIKLYHNSENKQYITQYQWMKPLKQPNINNSLRNNLSIFHHNQQTFNTYKIRQLTPVNTEHLSRIQEQHYRQYTLSRSPIKQWWKGIYYQNFQPSVCSNIPQRDVPPLWISRVAKYQPASKSLVNDWV